MEGRNGIELLDGERLLPHTVFDLKHWRAQIADRKTLDTQLDQVILRRVDPGPAKPVAKHPWRRAILTNGCRESNRKAAKPSSKAD